MAPNPITFGEEEIAFNSELGRTVSQWASVEQALYSLTALSVSTIDRGALFYGFFSIVNFRSKLAFADKMLTSKFEKHAHYADWPPLLLRVGNGAERRNELVHRRTHGFINEEPGRRLVLLEWPKIDDKPPPGTVAGDAWKPPTDAYGVVAINAIRFQFLDLWLGLRKLEYRFSGAVPPPEFDAQQENPLTIQTLVDQMHGVLGHPPQPSIRKQLQETRDADVERAAREYDEGR